MTKINVLFLCTGNSARSQMAEAFLKKYGSDRFEAFSAGLDPKAIHSFTRQVMGEIGISLEGHWSKDVREYLGKVHFGYLITVCDEAEKNCPAVFPGVGQRLHWNYEDPAAFVGTEEETRQKFRDIRDKIKQRIKLWISEPKKSESQD
jgi:arsenate reductase